MEFCKLFYLKKCYLFESRAAEFHVCHVYKFEWAVRHVVEFFFSGVNFSTLVFSTCSIFCNRNLILSKYVYDYHCQRLLKEQNYLVKVGVVHLARANFRTQITNWSVNVPQAKIVLHLPFWFVISSCYGSAMFASKPRIQRNGKTNWTAAEGVYNNSLEFPESFTTVANFRVFL